MIHEKRRAELRAAIEAYTQTTADYVRAKSADPGPLVPGSAWDHAGRACDQAAQRVERAIAALELPIVRRGRAWDALQKHPAEWHGAPSRVDGSDFAKVRAEAYDAGRADAAADLCAWADRTPPRTLAPYDLRQLARDVVGPEPQIVGAATAGPPIPIGTVVAIDPCGGVHVRAGSK